MKKRILTCLILILCIVSCCFVMTSCKKKKQNSNTTQTAQDGKTGVSIQSIEYDNDGNLLVTFTNGTTQTVILPEIYDSSWSEGLHFIQKPSGEYRVAGLGIASDIDIVIPATYNGMPVTEISSGAFYCEPNIKSVTIPSSVVTIGEQAFYGCEDLVTVNLSEGLQTIGTEAFAACVSLSSFNVPSTVEQMGSSILKNSGIQSFSMEGVTYIPNRMFENCYNLTNVTIPESVVEIGEYAFSNCDALYNLYLGNGVAEIEPYAFTDCDALTYVVFGTGISYVGSYAFYDCDSLYTGSVTIADIESWCSVEFADVSAHPMAYAGSMNLNGYAMTEIVIPATVTEIKPYAFYNCQTISSVVISDGVIEIGSYAFVDCHALLNVTLGNTVTTIGYYAFENCNNLTNISIGEGIECIDTGAFTGCENLSSVDISDLSAWCAVEFGAVDSNSATHPFYHASEVRVNGTVIEEIVIPAGVTEIKPWAFAFMPNTITSVEFEETVALEIINSYAFFESSIEEIRIPETVASIGEYAFYSCDNLVSVGITTGTTYISSYAFDDCYALIIYYEGSSYSYDWSSYWNYENCPVIYNWNKEGVTYTFEYNGAKETEAIFDYFAVEFPEYSYGEYVLAGWYEDSSYSGTRYIAGEEYYASYDVILYARWMTEQEYNAMMADGSSMEKAKPAYSGESYYVVISTSNQQVYFKFIPTYTGYYTIYSSNNNGDTYGYLYNSQGTRIASDDDNGGSRNFLIRQQLYAGETYYIGAGMFSSNTGHYYLYITRG